MQDTSKNTKRIKSKSEIEASLIERIDEVQMHATEFKEMHEEAKKCDFNNLIRSAKIKRLGELHISRAQSLVSKANG